jgi:hypothetical protein
LRKVLLAPTTVFTGVELGLTARWSIDRRTSGANAVRPRAGSGIVYAEFTWALLFWQSSGTA